MDGGTGAAAAKERDEGVPRYCAQMGGKEVGEVPTVPYRTGPVPACSVVLCSAQCLPLSSVTGGSGRGRGRGQGPLGRPNREVDRGKEAPKARLAQHDTAQQSPAQHSTVQYCTVLCLPCAHVDTDRPTSPHIMSPHTHGSQHLMQLTESNKYRSVSCHREMMTLAFGGHGNAIIPSPIDNNSILKRPGHQSARLPEAPEPQYGTGVSPYR